MKPRILVIDDDPEFLEMMQELLGERYLVSVAEDAFQGTECLMEHTYDLVILDDQMPGMSGQELANLMAASSRLSKVPIVFCSGFPEVLKRASRLHYAILPKPFMPHELFDKLHLFSISPTE